jgi:hypothetical protein
MDNKDQHIKGAIKNSFNAQKRKAPENLWNSISTGTSLTEDELTIRDSFNSVEKKAPTHSWQRIKKSVIIDEVWDRISEKQRKRRRAFWIWNIGGIALLVGMLIQFYTSQQKTQKNISSTDTNQEIVIDETIKNSETYDNSIIEQDVEVQNSKVGLTENPILQEDKDQLAQYNTVNRQLNNISEKIETADNISISENQTTVNPIIIQKEYMKEEDVAKNNEYELNSEIENKKDLAEDISKMPFSSISTITQSKGPFSNLHEIEIKIKPNVQRFEIGLISGLNNTWIFNNNVIEGLNSKSLIKNDFSLGYNFGVVTNYNFNLRSTISLEYDFISELNQGYEYFTKGRLYTRDIKLNHQKIGISYKLNFVQSPLDKNYFVLKTGGFFSFAQRSETSGVITSENDHYIFTQNDFGLNLAFGNEHKLNHFKIEYGLQSDIGLLNISTDSPNSPKKFNYTNTYLLGVYASIRYLF